MLREVFKTVTFPYRTKNPSDSWLEYDNTVLPYIEEIAGLLGLVTSKSTPGVPSTIYTFASLNVRYWPSWDHGYWVFDGSTGKLVRRVIGPSFNATWVFGMGTIVASRKGKLWALNSYGTQIQQLSLGATATALPSDEPQKAVDWSLIGPQIPASKYIVDPVNDPDGPLHGFGAGGTFAIDDELDVFIDGSFNDFRVFKFSTGAFKYGITMPSEIVAICLEDDSRCYILIGNNTVMLFDYMRGEVLGAAQIPPLSDAGSYWNRTGIRMAWDPVYRRLLVWEKTPDNPDGSCTQVIRGFSMVNEPCRLTKPIPLKVPRRGRVIPVLVQVLDERNAGVGGYVVDATVT